MQVDSQRSATVWMQVSKMRWSLDPRKNQKQKKKERDLTCTFLCDQGLVTKNY